MFGLVPYKKNINDINKMFDFILQDFILTDDNTKMKVDIKEREEEYILEAELPGIKKEEIVLEAKDNILTISIEKDEKIDEEKENYIIKERRYGSMSRSFSIDNVNIEKIKAKFENGILSVTLPKLESKNNKSKKINIE